MKNCGRLLLAIGFVWLVISAELGSSMNVAAASKMYGSLPQQETFSKSEVHHIIDDFYELNQRGFQWELMMLAPACLMLIGGFILDRVAMRQAKQLRQSNSN